MYQRPYVKLDTSEKPSKLLALIALVVACMLPFILVKTVNNKSKTEYTHQSLTLPHLADIPKENSEAPVVNDWQYLSPHPGDTLSSIFNRLKLSAQTLQAVLRDNPHAKILTSIKPGQELQFKIHEQTLEKIIIPMNGTQFLVVTKTDKGNFESQIHMRKMNSHNHFVTATVKGSLYTTAKRLNIPMKLVQQMTELFSWEINFARDIRAGDQFTIMYKAYYIEDKLVNTGEILAVSYTNKGKTHQAIRHVSQSGNIDYYTPEGNSLKKAFNRYPMKFSHISSTFSTGRYHPVLHYTRPHKGIDLAAPIGTPIHATGNGRIDVIGRQNGYGNMIKIKHDGSFSSVYGHMLKFQKGLKRGDFVKRGDIIGYVGQTGLANGPHCHYEFHVNTIARNPTTVDLPHSLPVPARELASFKANSGTLLAHLKLFEDAHLAGQARKTA